MPLRAAVMEMTPSMQEGEHLVEQTQFDAATLADASAILEQLVVDSVAQETVIPNDFEAMQQESRTLDTSVIAEANAAFATTAEHGAGCACPNCQKTMQEADALAEELISEVLGGGGASQKPVVNTSADAHPTHSHESSRTLATELLAESQHDRSTTALENSKLDAAASERAVIAEHGAGCACPNCQKTMQEADALAEELISEVLGTTKPNPELTADRVEEFADSLLADQLQSTRAAALEKELAQESTGLREAEALDLIVQSSQEPDIHAFIQQQLLEQAAARDREAFEATEGPNAKDLTSELRHTRATEGVTHKITAKEIEDRELTIAQNITSRNNDPSEHDVTILTAIASDISHGGVEDIVPAEVYAHESSPDIMTDIIHDAETGEIEILESLDSELAFVTEASWSLPAQEMLTSRDTTEVADVSAEAHTLDYAQADLLTVEESEPLFDMEAQYALIENEPVEGLANTNMQFETESRLTDEAIQKPELREINETVTPEVVIEEIPELEPITATLSVVLETIIAAQTDEEIHEQVEQTVVTLSEMIEMLEGENGDRKIIDEMDKTKLFEKLETVTRYLGIDTETLAQMLDTDIEELAVSPLFEEIIQGLRKLISLEYSFEFIQSSNDDTSLQDSTNPRNLGRLILGFLLNNRKPQLVLAGA